MPRRKKTLHKYNNSRETLSRKEWRDFELLVSRIAKFLFPKDAIIKTPDEIFDFVAKKNREVDASVRFILNSNPILITFECRKRSGNQDITWIEQLATKKHDIGANATVAVVSSGFSKAAKLKADYYGIEVRQLKDVIDEDILSKYRSVGTTLLKYSCDSLKYGYAGYIRDVNGYYDSKLVISNNLVGESLSQHNIHPLFGKILFNFIRGFRISISDIFKDKAKKQFSTQDEIIELSPYETKIISYSPEIDILYEDVPDDGTKIEKPLHITWPNNLALLVETDKGLMLVKEFAYKLLLYKTPYHYEQANVFNYLTDNSNMYFGEKTIQLNNMQSIVTFTLNGL